MHDSSHSVESSSPPAAALGHTPGPWSFQIDRQHNEWQIVGPTRSGIGMSLMGNAAYYPWVPEREADWRLIAAAPDLLAALQRFTAATLTDAGQVVGLMREDFDNARIVIAKATGAASEASPLSGSVVK